MIWLYPAIVTLAFISIHFLLLAKLRRVKRQKVKGLKGRAINESIETDSPVENQEAAAKEKGLTALENRFSFMRRSLPLLLFMLWLIIILMPFLSKMPSVYVTIFTAILSVIAGVALRPFLENLFSGVVISFFKSIRIGDTVILDGHYGLIEEIGLTYSVVKRWDWNRLVLPNAKLMQKEIENLTLNDSFIWAYVEFFVTPQADLREVENLAISIASESNFFNGSEKPSFWVMSLNRDSVKCWVAAWADTPSDAWGLRNDINTNLCIALSERGITTHQNNIKLETDNPDPRRLGHVLNQA